MTDNSGTTSQCTIDDHGPLPAVQPGSVAELCALVRRAAAQGQAIYPLGGRTMLLLGLPPAKPGFGIDLRGLDRVIDYPARDMTITVQAGITVARLQAILQAENQRLPVDVPLANQATLGGAIAVNASGPRRYGLGTLRDYVIGISLVNGEGQEVKAGGRVVKNVAGYDLCKLCIGSLGSFGIITQATLKLRPVTEQSALQVIACPHAAQLASLLDRLHESRTRPVCITVLSPAAARLIPPIEEDAERIARDAWLIFVGFEDQQKTVEWQLQQLKKEISPETPFGPEWWNAAARPIWQTLTDFPLAGPPAAGPAITFKANMLPRATALFCQRATALDPELLLEVHAGNGIVVGHLAGGLDLDRGREILQTLQRGAAAAQGNMILLRCPPAWKRSLPVWGAPRGDLDLMRTIKEKLDPAGVFNPGRFVDGSGDRAV